MTAAASIPATRVGTTAPDGSLLRRLIEEPERFGFDAAVAILLHAAGGGEPGRAIRFKAAAGLAFAPAEVARVELNPNGAVVTAGLLGLTGPLGVLPRPYTEVNNAELRRRSRALADFLDLLAQRPLAHLASAGIKYRPHRAADAAGLGRGEDGPAPADGLREILLALLGYGTPGLADRLAVGSEPLLHLAGQFAMRPRSADRLAAIVSDWLGEPVEVDQFAGFWLSLGPEEMTALPVGDQGRFHQLGVDAAIGSRTWDLQSRIVLRVGPLDLRRFEALLPDRDLLARLASLLRAFLGLEVTFAVNLVLAASEVPPLELTPATPPRLGWNSWLATGGTRLGDAGEAVFEAALIEEHGENRCPGTTATSPT